MNKVSSRLCALTLLSASALGLVGCGTGVKIAKLGIDQYFLLDTEMPTLSITSAYVTSSTDLEYEDSYIVSYDITTNGFAGYMDFYYDDSTGDFTIEGIMATTQAEFDDSEYQAALPIWESEYEEIVYGEEHPDEYPDYKFEKLNSRDLNAYISQVS